MESVLASTWRRAGFLAAMKQARGLAERLAAFVQAALVLYASAHSRVHGSVYCSSFHLLQ